MSKKWIGIILWATISVQVHAAKLGATFEQKPVTESMQIEAARGVMDRLIPKISDNFDLKIIKKLKGYDVFELEQRGSKIELRGSSGVAICSAFNYYLQTYGHCDVSWCGDQVKLPTPLPKIPKKVRVISPSKYRVYFNYCTLSYTAPWWDWKRWQREVDFMALKGINMPLAPTGLEGVWFNVLQDFKMSEDDARAFLCGPAHMAWQWMTNIQSLGGPLPKKWINDHITLGQKIIEQERSLGMIPIQQGFSGFVPVKFKELYPKAKIHFKPEWEGRGIKTTEIDPRDLLFVKFGAAFMAEQKRLFGESHYYAADPFHEGKPPVDGNKYLVAVGKVTYGVMKKHDNDAIWVMPTLSIREYIARTAPKGRLLVLDLAGGNEEKTNNFWGYPFVTGVLHNLGGRMMLHGDLDPLAKNIVFSRRKKSPNIAGMGLFMEGTMQNPVYYNMALDSIWRTKSVNTTEWLHDYARRRYGAPSEHANKAWDLLLQSAYSKTTGGTEKGSIVAMRPSLRVLKTGPQSDLSIPYDPKILAQAWDELLADQELLKASNGYQFDVVDIGRQTLANLALELHYDVCFAYYAKDKKAYEKASKKFLDTLRDLNELVGTRPEYRLNQWIVNARKWGRSSAEKKQYEEEARMLLTRWGPLTMDQAWDSAWREWHGLVGNYYLKRWTMFHEYLAEQVSDKEAGFYDDSKGMSQNRPALRATPFLDKLTDWEVSWITAGKPSDYALPMPPRTSIAFAQTLHEKYKADIQRVYNDPERAAKVKEMLAKEYKPLVPVAK